MEYWYKDIDILHPADYLENINSFSFIKAIVVKNGDGFKHTVQLDCFNDFTKYIIENNFELLFDVELLMEYQSETVSFDYFLLDLSFLDKVAKKTTLNFLLDLIDVLDTSYNKFKLLNEIHNSESQKIVIKLSRSVRNIGLFPIREQKIESLLDQIENYDYGEIEY
ncbi:hypothetical protein [Bizionia sp.]|uniref:hypothetical protein n=1 Tax=Bizionia sp. TaxID=1954480 RepID=UPI003A8F2130